jgi:CubicO group peptidase (beta-lactamase class C family)
MLKVVASAFAVGLWMITVAAQPPTRGGSIEGLWGAVYVGGPRVRGELTITAVNGGYVAAIAGFETRVTGTASDLRFALPSGNGEFRGSLDRDRNGISGHWIQAQGPVSFQPRATPVDLRLRAPGVWSGVVTPLDERMHLFVDIRRDAGSLTAVIRIPETNRGGNQRLAVQLDGDQVVLKGPPDIRGSYDARTDRLLLSLYEQPHTFSRLNPDDAVGFYARSPRNATYTYRPPAGAGDGWKTGTIREARLDDRPLAAFIQSILGADGADPASIPVHSLLIARHGQLVMEEYFYGFERDRPHDTRSAGKTFAPMLIGIARDRGAKVAPDTPLAALPLRSRPFANDDARKQRLTVEDVMTMRAGLACDDNDPMSPGGEDRMQRQRDQPDWYKYTVDLPMVSEPGGPTAVYCSAALNLAGGVAGAVTGTWNGDLFHRYVARPLQFGTYHLNLMPTGDAYFGGGVYLRPRDALKLGQLYLNGGTWNGVRVVSKEWVDRSTKAYGTFARPVVEADVNHQYGYGWHIHHFTVGGRTYREFAAEGNGGQLVMVFPELAMVVGINAGKYGSPAWYRWSLEITPKYLIPAAAPTP